jgi:hypothetical protein
LHVRLTVDDPAALDVACDDLQELMARVDRAAGRFRPTFELSKLNRNAGTLVPVSPPPTGGSGTATPHARVAVGPPDAAVRPDRRTGRAEPRPG